MIISSGNYINKTYTMPDDMMILGGNFAFSNVILNGHTLTIGPEANVTKIQVNGVVLTSPPPAGVVLLPGVILNPTYTPDTRTLLPAAVKLHKSVEARETDLGKAVLRLIAIIQAGSPTQTAPTALAAYDAWASTTKNLISGSALATFFQEDLGVATWAQLRDTVRAYSEDVWLLKERV